jgi:hypothetical protein
VSDHELRAHRGGRIDRESGSSDASAGEAVDAGAISPMFKLLFFSTLGITLASMLGMIILPFFASAEHDPQAAADTCATVFKMGVGVLFGLISGKAA